MEDKKSDSKKDFRKGVLMYLIGVPFHHFDHLVPPKSDYQATKDGYTGAMSAVAAVVLLVGLLFACALWGALRGQ